MGRTSGGSNSQQVVSEPMADDLWADSPGSIGGCGLARRLSEEQEKSIVTLDGARKFLVRAAGGWQQGGSRWSGYSRWSRKNS
jgi:hypothetical protein